MWLRVRMAVNGPWYVSVPTRAALGIGVVFVVLAPTLLFDEAGRTLILPIVVPAALIAAAVPLWERRQLAGRTGWSWADYVELRRDAAYGIAPPDAADRETLLDELDTEVRQQRGVPTVVAVAVAFYGVAALVRGGAYPGHGEWVAAAWSALCAGLVFLILRRQQARRRALLARLEDAIEAEPQPESEPEPQPVRPDGQAD